MSSSPVTSELPKLLLTLHTGVGVSSFSSDWNSKLFEILTPELPIDSSDTELEWRMPCFKERTIGIAMNLDLPGRFVDTCFRCQPLIALRIQP